MYEYTEAQLEVMHEVFKRGGNCQEANSRARESLPYGDGENSEDGGVS